MNTTEETVSQVTDQTATIAMEVVDATSHIERSPDAALARIRELAWRSRDAAHAYEEAREVAKDKKGVWEAAARELESACINESKPMPLFDALPAPSRQAGPKQPASAAPAADESWRESLVSCCLEVSDKIVQSLADAGLHTVGDLADFTAGKAAGGFGPLDRGRLLNEVAGIGNAKASQIEVALEDFWAARASGPAA